MKYTLEIEGKAPTTGELEFVQLYQIKHDFELMAGVRKEAPCPEVYRLEPYGGILLTEELQWFWYNLMVIENHGLLSEEELKQAWRNLTAGNRAFTNGRGTDTCRDYVSNRNFGAALPVFFTLVCGGNVLTGIEGSYGGALALKINTIDTRNLNGVSRITTPWLVYYGTVVTTKETVIRFPQLDGNEVPVPVFGNQPIYYPLSQLKKLPLGSLVPNHLSY